MMIILQGSTGDDNHTTNPLTTSRSHTRTERTLSTNSVMYHDAQDNQSRLFTTIDSATFGMWCDMVNCTITTFDNGTEVVEQYRNAVDFASAMIERCGLHEMCKPPV